jgi:hypothetical protein
VKVADTHVTGRTVEGEDEVLREDVLGVVGIDEEVGERCGGVHDQLAAVEAAEELGDSPVDRGAVGGTAWVPGVDRRQVGLVVDDQSGDVAELVPQRLEVRSELAQHREVLLDHDEAGVGRHEIDRVVERLGPVRGVELHATQPLLEPAVIVVEERHALDARQVAGKEVLSVTDEAVLEPVLVIGVVELICRRVGQAPGEILDPDQLPVETSLSLRAQQLDRSGHDDHQPVTRIDGLGDDTGEVGRLAALDVPDDQALGLVAGGGGGVGDPADDLRRGAIEGCDRLGGPVALIE